MTIAMWVLADRLFSRTPQQMGLRPDGDARLTPVALVRLPAAQPRPGALLWHDLKFLTLSAGMALGLFAQIGLITHLFSLLVPALGAQRAVLAMGLATGSAIAGRTLVGWIMPAEADRRVVASASYAVQITGSIVFILAAGSSIPLLFLGVVLFGVGIGIGNATSLPPLIAQVEFPEDRVPRVVALTVAVAQAAYAFAPATFDSGQGIRPACIRHGLLRSSGRFRRCRVCTRAGDLRIFARPNPITRRQATPKRSLGRRCRRLPQIAFRSQVQATRLRRPRW